MALSNILVIIDPTQENQPAFERALDSARDTGATLLLYGCVPEDSSEDSCPVLDALAERASGAGIDVNKEVERASDWAEHAVAAAARHGVSMIFKNSTEHSSIDREKRRTSDWTLLRSSPCPVLMVKNFHDWNQRRVLAAINPETTEAAHIKLNHQIINFTRQMSSTYGSDAHFVTAFRDLNHPPNEGEIAQQCGTDEDHIHTAKGQAAEVIREVAESLDVDLIIVGTVGRDGIKGRVVGNTCERLLDQTHSDVLVLN